MLPYVGLLSQNLLLRHSAPDAGFPKWEEDAVMDANVFVLGAGARLGPGDIETQSQGQ
jgi:hypothetical protein